MAVHPPPPCDRCRAPAGGPRDAAGDLHAGIRATIAGRDGVDVETVDVVALRPRLNDLTVTVDASIRLAPVVEVDDLQ